MVARPNKKAFTLIELLVTLVIIGILTAVGVVAYNGYTKAAKIAATKANHATITKMIAAKAASCSIGELISYLDITGAQKTFSCPTTIDNFIAYMNQTIYGMNWESPFYGSNPPSASWCRINVTNCSPPGYMSACPDSSRQAGYLSVFPSGDKKTIKICSSAGKSHALIEDTIIFYGLVSGSTP